MTTLTQTDVQTVATVFGRANCPQCDFTKREFERAGVPIRYFDITDAPRAAASLKTSGFTSLPVVFPTDRTVKPWAGFRPNLIAALAEGRAAA